MCPEYVRLLLPTSLQDLLQRKYSASSDVWSYGIVMFEIWSAGCKPFENKTAVEVSQLLTKRLGSNGGDLLPSQQVTIIIQPIHFDTISLQVIGAFQQQTDYIQGSPPGCPLKMYRIMVICW